MSVIFWLFDKAVILWSIIWVISVSVVSFTISNLISNHILSDNVIWVELPLVVILYFIGLFIIERIEK